MKRQKSKAPTAFSGFILGCGFVLMLAVAFQLGFIKPGQIISDSEIKIPSEAGHWLKTARDKDYAPGSLIRTPVTDGAAANDSAAEIQLEKARTQLNKTNDTLNIMYIWTDQKKLNVISVTTFNKTTGQAAITVIPLHTVIDSGNVVYLGSHYQNISELYQSQGREGVREFLEEKLQIQIPYYVHVNQSALEKLSNIFGVLQINGDHVTMLEAFEQTVAGIRTDDRDVVRAVANRVLQPGIVLEVPTIIDIFTDDIKTNMSVQEMIRIFYLSRNLNLAHMQKTSLPGYEEINGIEKHLFVSENTWKNIIYNITNSSTL